MGNETSSMKIHSLLTAEDLKDLRTQFPGGGASATPVTSLNWGAWKQAWPQDRYSASQKPSIPRLNCKSDIFFYLGEVPWKDL